MTTSELKSLLDEYRETKSKPDTRYVMSDDEWSGGYFNGFNDAVELLLPCLEALEFYSSRDSYDLHEIFGKVCVMEKDCEAGVWDDDPHYKDIKTAGKRARQAIASLELKLKEHK